jgi:glycyl-tRNA synthetase beta chain
MERELLIEIGVEEMPASWLPALTEQLKRVVEARLSEFRLSLAAPVETFSTPRRLTARVAKLAERQEDLEEILTGPPVSAAVDANGQPTPAGLGFAKKQSVDFAELTRIQTPKGEYLAYNKRQRGHAAVDVLADVLAGVLRDLSFPKGMRWDAELADGRGELFFGRPIRWLLFLYGGRVVPFTIGRSALARGGTVADVDSEAVTYGHRFLATSGRPGRSIKVRHFDEYRAKLSEHFVILDRDERRDRIRRELELHARRLGGRVRQGHGLLLDEVPDLVEYPSVIAGTYDPAFLALPEEVLTTTMIHHQHYFPIVDDAGKLKPAFLAVTNADPQDGGRGIATNAERVLTARLRDARFFWDADRRIPLEDRLERLDTVVFHKKAGSYRDKSRRIEALARWIASDVLRDPEAADHAATAARLAKTDLTTDMVREFTELQGVMGGLYAREAGQPEPIWKAVYYQYLPVGVEADAPPTRAQLGAAAVTWTAVAVADKLDTIVTSFAAGERPTGSRDPFGLRRNAQAVVKILIDLPELTGLDVAPSLGELIGRAAMSAGGEAPRDSAPSESEARQALGVGPQRPSTSSGRPEPAEGRKEKKDDEWPVALAVFMIERVRYVLGERGVPIETVRAVTHQEDVRPLRARRVAEALEASRASADFQALAVLFKRVKNIAKELTEETGGQRSKARGQGPEARITVDRSALTEPAERALLAELDKRRPAIEQAAGSGDYRRAFAEIAGLQPVVDRFFTDVFVMVDDVRLRTARLTLMAELRDLVVNLADISEVVPQES